MCDKSTINAISGAMVNKTITVLNADGTAHSVAGYNAIEMQVRKNKNATSVFDADLTDGLTRSGNIITLSKALDADIAPGVYYYDIDLITTGGAAPVTTIKGKFLIDWEVTKQAV